MDKELLRTSVVAGLLPSILVFVMPIVVPVEFYLTLTSLVTAITYSTVSKLRPEDPVDRAKRKYKQGKISEEEFENELEKEMS